MKIYTTFWTYGIRNNEVVKNKHMTVFFMEQFIKYVKHIYGEVHLITDSNGYEYLNNLGFTSIDLYLDNVNKKYRHIWNYGKLNCINYLSKKKEHFIHLDYDFFICKKMPDYIESADVAFQSEEHANYFFYGKDYFLENCKNKYLSKEFDYKNENTAYNCGIIGGKNYDFFEKYTDSALKMIHDPENENFWFKDWREIDKYKEFTKCILAEQYYAYLYCKEMNIVPELYWPTIDYDPRIKKFFLERGATHLYGGYKVNFYRKMHSIKTPLTNQEFN